jgi:hypothetical protein
LNRRQRFALNSILPALGLPRLLTGTSGC